MYSWLLLLHGLVIFNLIFLRYLCLRGWNRTMLSYRFSALLTLSGYSIFCVLFPIQSGNHPAIQLVYFGWQGLSFILGWRTFEHGDYSGFVAGLQQLRLSCMMGCGYWEPLRSTAGGNLAVAEVRQHVCRRLWVRWWVSLSDWDSSSWKSPTNGPWDDGRSSQPVRDCCRLQPALPRGRGVGSPNLDLFSRETCVERGTLCWSLVVFPKKRMLKTARFQTELCTQQVPLGWGGQAERCSHEQEKTGRFFRKADFRCPGKTRVKHLGLGHSACTGGKPAGTQPSPQSCRGSSGCLRSEKLGFL